MRGVRLRPTRGFSVILGLVTALFVASRTTGSGWLSVMVALAVAGLAWSTISPVLMVRRLSVEISGPTDGVVNRPMMLTVSVDGPAGDYRLRLLEPLAEPRWIRAPQVGAMQVVPERRGVATTVEYIIESGGPAGLLWAGVRSRAELFDPIEVAPMVRAVHLPPAAVAAGQGETSVGGRRNEGETVRTVREYVPGDPPRMIHWAATARRDEPVVKELETPQSPALHISLDLRGDTGVAEAHASLAAGYVQAGLRSGLPVVLHTYEATGPHSGGVGSMLEAGRRLARAVPGSPPQPAGPGRATSVHLGPR